MSEFRAALSYLRCDSSKMILSTPFYPDIEDNPVEALRVCLIGLILMITLTSLCHLDKFGSHLHIVHGFV